MYKVILILDNFFLKYVGGTGRWEDQIDPPTPHLGKTKKSNFIRAKQYQRKKYQQLIQYKKEALKNKRVLFLLKCDTKM